MCFVHDVSKTKTLFTNCVQLQNRPSLIALYDTELSATNVPPRALRIQRQVPAYCVWEKVPFLTRKNGH